LRQILLNCRSYYASREHIGLTAYASAYGK
jgi:hypothetical protein